MHCPGARGLLSAHCEVFLFVDSTLDDLQVIVDIMFIKLSFTLTCNIWTNELFHYVE